MSDYDSQILKTGAIYLWISTKLLIQKIALKLKTDHEFVKRSIHEYKKAVRNQLKINKLKAASNKLAISLEKIEEIKVFWKENNGKMIRIQDVRAGVWKLMRMTEFKKYNYFLGNDKEAKNELQSSKYSTPKSRKWRSQKSVLWIDIDPIFINEWLSWINLCWWV